MMPSSSSGSLYPTLVEQSGEEHCLEDTNSDSICLEPENQAHTRYFNLDLHHQAHTEPSYELLNPIERYLKEGAAERYSLFCIHSRETT